MAAAQADLAPFAAERQPAIRACMVYWCSRKFAHLLRGHFSCDLRSDPGRLRIRPRFAHTVIDYPGAISTAISGSELSRRYRATLFPNAPHPDCGFVIPGVILDWVRDSRR